MSISQSIAEQLAVSIKQVESTVQLLDEGATVPFIARYRKEVTGGLTDTQLRNLNDKLMYLRELNDRRDVILKSIESQGKLTDVLKGQIIATDSKTRLEDLYLPYRPKRRTKAQIAKEAGLEGLATRILTEFDLDVEEAASNYVNADKGVADPTAALEGARYILMEAFCEHANLLADLRTYYKDSAIITSVIAKGKEHEGQKFKDYFEFSELIGAIPSHRILALLRGRKEGYLQLKIQFEDEELAQSQCCARIKSAFDIPDQVGHWLQTTVQWAYKIKLHLKLELEFMMALKKRAEEEAIRVFSSNLKNLLMSAPAGKSVVLGLDPGFRTGVKTVVCDNTGKLLDHTVIYPHAPQKKWDQSLAELERLCRRHKVKLVSIGNGTASRETDQLAAELLKRCNDLAMIKVVVSEAGASVYSASELAAKEFPTLDVSYRGAVSIARRLQDPLAELVKIEPKAIGVGQYQHDVNQIRLGRALQGTVEDCVNAVGADVNTASVPLLSSISGLNETIANNIVAFRNENGRFKNRAALKKVPRLGAKTFEQAAGFLRIMDSNNPLDRSGVHPESYCIVNNMAAVVGCDTATLIGNEDVLSKLNLSRFVTDAIGLMTLQDITNELRKPGRDPRPEFAMAHFKEGVNEVADLTAGMQLEGVITNVANFGAFVDIGVHQDGLVHVSQIADHFVEDVHAEVKVGQIVQVKVLEVDVKRQRISLTMKLRSRVDTCRNGTSGGESQQRHSRRSARKKFKGLAQSENSLAQQLRERVLTE